MEIKNAVIDSTSLNFGDRGCLMSFVNFDYGGSFQGFGGYLLYAPKGWTHHDKLSPAGHWIVRVCECAGVTDWDKLKGMTVRVKLVDGLIKSIGHIVKDDWFTPSIDFKDIK